MKKNKRPFFLEDELSQEVTETPETKYIVDTDKKFVTLRETPSGEARILSLIDNGSVVELISHEDKYWSKVSVPSKALVGFIVYTVLRKAP